MFSWYEPEPIDITVSDPNSIKPTAKLKPIAKTVEFIMIEWTPTFMNKWTTATLTYRLNGEDKTATVKVGHEQVLMSNMSLINAAISELAKMVVKAAGGSPSVLNAMTDYIAGKVQNLNKKNPAASMADSLYFDYKAKKFEIDAHQNVIAEKSRRLPGVDEVVDLPCVCMGPISVWEGVIHLNDACKWSREKIADWLDELHDKGEINIEFQPWGEEQKKEEIPSTASLDGWESIGYTTDDSLGTSEFYIAPVSSKSKPLSWDIVKSKMDQIQKIKEDDNGN